MDRNTKLSGLFQFSRTGRYKSVNSVTVVSLQVIGLARICAKVTTSAHIPLTDAPGHPWLSSVPRNVVCASARETSTPLTRIICLSRFDAPCPVFKLFRPKPVTAQTPSNCPPSAELRGTTTEGYHFALRLERNRSGQAQRLIGWHGSSRGGARVEMQCGPDGVWRDLQGRHAAVIDDLIPHPIRHSGGWAGQWEQLALASAQLSADGEDAAPSRPALDAR